MNNDIVSLVNECEKELQDQFKKIDDICMYHSNKVLESFRSEGVNETCFNMTTGYGINDFGRDVIERVYAKVFNAEQALVRNQFISGSHALCVTLFGLLRPDDTLLTITGTPYDALQEVIGIIDNPSSLKSFKIKYEQIELKDDDFDYEKIEHYLLNNKVKVLHIQRSVGYSTRKSLNIEKLEKVIKFIKNIDSNIIIMVDNCYCEMVEKLNPIEVGADVIVGSLIKNLGAGIASNGAYVAGKAKYVDLIAERLTLPGEGKNVGPSLGANKSILQGLFMAPSVVASASKTSTLTSLVMEKLGYDVEPKAFDQRVDIVTQIKFGNKDNMIKYIKGIQKGSPIDSNALPIPSQMDGYSDDIIMAAGCFNQGSTIELSCDGPIREPFIAYQQGGLTYEYGKLGVIIAIDYLLNNK